MANEPERPIEKLLRAAAKKRRDEAGAPLELHPATRRLLQGEVARKFAQAGRERRSFLQGLGRLWPRFAWGLAILVLMFVAPRLLFPPASHNESAARLAKSESRSGDRMLQAPSRGERMNEPLSGLQPPLPPKGGERKGEGAVTLPSRSLASPAKDSLPPASPAQPASPAPPASTVETLPAAVALADKARPASASPAARPGTDGTELPTDRFAVPLERAPGENLSSAAVPQLADRRTTTEAQLAASAATAPVAPAAAVNGAYQPRAGLGGNPAPPASTAAPPASPAPVAATPNGVAVVAADESAKLTGDTTAQSAFAYKSLSAAAPANRPQAAPATTDGLLLSAEAARRETRSFSAAQRFTQVAAGPKTTTSPANKTTPAHPVLASFQVEQAGPALRIVDEDGSVYSGYVQIAGNVRRAPAVTAAAPAAASQSRALGEVTESPATATFDSVQLAPQTYFFRVAGTNRSLHKRVVFTGSLLTATNLTSSPLVATNLSVGAGVGRTRAGSAQPVLVPLLNSRIAGKVVIGSGKPVEINAVPATP